MSSNLRRLLDEAVARNAAALRAIPDEIAGSRPAREGAWNQRQELGHLIDSAANNHLRAVRAALDGEYRGPGYDQNGWVRLHGYEGLPWPVLIDFWETLNRLLAEVVGRIPEDRWTAACVIGDGEPLTLKAMVEDYVRHMQHHLDHILAPRPL